LGSFIDCSLSLTRLCFDGSGFNPCRILSIGWLYPVTKWLRLRDFGKHACIPTFFTIFFHEKIQINTD
jgi:hypothetical protein